MASAWFSWEKATQFESTSSPEQTPEAHLGQQCEKKCFFLIQPTAFACPCSSVSHSRAWAPLPCLRLAHQLILMKTGKAGGEQFGNAKSLSGRNSDLGVTVSLDKTKNKAPILKMRELTSPLAFNKFGERGKGNILLRTEKHLLTSRA